MLARRAPRAVPTGSPRPQPVMTRISRHRAGVSIIPIHTPTPIHHFPFPLIRTLHPSHDSRGDACRALGSQARSALLLQRLHVSAPRGAWAVKKRGVWGTRYPPRLLHAASPPCPLAPTPQSTPHVVQSQPSTRNPTAPTPVPVPPDPFPQIRTRNRTASTRVLKSPSIQAHWGCASASQGPTPAMTHPHPNAPTSPGPLFNCQLL